MKWKSKYLDHKIRRSWFGNKIFHNRMKTRLPVFWRPACCGDCDGEPGALHRGPFVGAPLNGSASLVSVAAERAHPRWGPIVFIGPSACFKAHLAGSFCWSLENTSTGPSGSDCLLWDIKAKRPVHPRRSCGQKEQQREEKGLWTAIPASAFHSNSCWYLLFLWC